MQTLQELNPELRRWTTPLRATDYELKVPEGTAEIVRVRLAETDPAELAPLNHHTVKKGETLLSISREAEGEPHRSGRGQLPDDERQAEDGAAADHPARADAAARDTDRQPCSAGGIAFASTRLLPTSAVVPAVNRTSEVKLVHRVKSGETLFSIAKLYRTTVASLKQWNHLRSNTIQTGQRLTILAKRALAATN